MTSERPTRPTPVRTSAIRIRRERAHEPPRAPATLRVETPSGALGYRALKRDTYDVGREAFDGILLGEHEVRHLHARLERDAAGRWWVVPVSKSSDTLVNGRVVRERHELSPWDDVQLGGYHLRLEAEGGAQVAFDHLVSLLLPFRGQGADLVRSPARVRLYDDGYDVRLDKGAVVFGSHEDATLRLEHEEGLYVEFRPLRNGRFEVIDRSVRPSMTVNGAIFFRWVLNGDDRVGIGDVERQRVNAFDALRVRFLVSERRPGEGTPPPNDTDPMMHMPDGDRAE